MKKTISYLIAPLVFVNACIAPQQHTWKTESIISTSYKPIRSEIESQEEYRIVAKVSETGVLDFKVWIGKFEINYDVVQPINLTKEREYNFGRSKVAATWVDLGLGSIALGVLLESVTRTKGSCKETYEYEDEHGQTIYSNDCISYEYEGGSVPAHLVLAAGLLTTGVSGLFYWGDHSKRDRPTKNYREVEIPAETYQRNHVDRTLLETVPAISAPVTISSPYFTIEGEQAIALKTDYKGNGSVQLTPTHQNFSFTLDQIAETAAAQQLESAGFSAKKYLPLLEQAAVPISYDVTIKTKAADGKNAESTIPVSGYEIPQKVLERVVMEL